MIPAAVGTSIPPDTFHVSYAALFYSFRAIIASHDSHISISRQSAFRCQHGKQILVMKKERNGL